MRIANALHLIDFLAFIITLTIFYTEILMRIMVDLFIRSKAKFSKNLDFSLFIVNLTKIDSNWILIQREFLAISPAKFFDLHKEKGQMSKVQRKIFTTEFSQEN